jgi:large subunit ribosomal protein L10
VALHNLGIEELDGDLGGQIAFVFSDKDAVVGTKVAHEFARRNERFILRGGYFNGRRIGVEELRALATLPSRRELEAGLVGVLAAPLTEFILTLTASLSEFIATLKARAEKLGEVAEAEAA